MDIFACVSTTPQLIYFGNAYTVPETFRKTLKKSLTLGLDSNNVAFHKPYTFGKSKFCDAIENPDFIKLAFVRDPVDRFCAVYYDRLAPEAEFSVAKEKLFSYLDLGDDEELSLSDFAKIVAHSELDRDVLAILRPQRKIIAYDLVDFNFIGHAENWAHDLDHFLASYLNVAAPKIAGLNNESEKIHENMFDIDAETQRNIEAAYVQDLEMIEEVSEL